MSLKHSRTDFATQQRTEHKKQTSIFGGSGRRSLKRSRTVEPLPASEFAEHARQTHDAFTSSREAGLKVAHTLAQNYATLVSGVLMGLSEAMQHGKPKK